MPMHVPIPEDLCGSLSFQLESLRRQIRDSVTTALDGQGFNIRQFWALTCLIEGDAASQSALCDVLDVDRSDMVRLIDSLEQAGLVERHRDPSDRRRQIITATAKGRRTQKGLRPIVEKAEQEALAETAPKQIGHLVAALRHVDDGAVASS